MLSLVSIAMYNYIIAHKELSTDTKVLNTINWTSDGDGTGTTTTAQNTQPSSALDENEKIKSLENMPRKCLGSALCPDYDYYPSTLRLA